MKIINVLNDSIKFINKHMADVTVEGVVDSIDNWFMTLDHEQLNSFHHVAYAELNDVLFNYYNSL